MVSHKQKGASLFIALIILVVLTLLAVSSMRGVVLENRITAAYVMDSKLFNQGETTVSYVENEIDKYLSHFVECSQESSKAILPSGHTVCIIVGSDNKLKINQVKFVSHSGTNIDNFKSKWYMMSVPSAGLNPEFGQEARGIGTFLYEITAKSEFEDDANEKLYVRTVYSKVFDG